MMELKVGGGAGGLVHRPDDVRALGVLGLQEPVEDLSQGGRLVQVVENDNRRQIRCVRLALLRYVRKVLSQLLTAFVLDAVKDNFEIIIRWTYFYA